MALRLSIPEDVEIDAFATAVESAGIQWTGLADALDVVARARRRPGPGLGPCYA